MSKFYNALIRYSEAIFQARLESINQIIVDHNIELPNSQPVISTKPVNTIKKLDTAQAHHP
jgi:hypothetical protein